MGSPAPGAGYDTAMTVTALLFASLRDAAGVARVELELPETATVRDAAAELERRCAGLRLRGALCAVDERYAAPDRPLAGGETVAFLPPVAGG